MAPKRPTSTYQPGTRGPDWIKAKNIRIQEVVVGGWSPGQGRREDRIGSLLLGIPDPNRTAGIDQSRELRYIGSVGTGLTHQLLADVARRRAPLAQPHSPFTAGSPVPTSDFATYAGKPRAEVTQEGQPARTGRVGHC